jgi:hypothetical protein
MMNIVEYRTVSAISSKELDNAVNRQLKMGFQPLGTPYVAGSGSSQSIYQALVRVDGASPADPEARKDEQPKTERSIVPVPPAQGGLTVASA